MIKAVRILESQLKKNIGKMLSDDYSMLIISHTINKCKSINDLSKECNIPINTVYRRIRSLVTQGLLVVERTVITDNGVKFDLYRSSIVYAKIEWTPPEDQQVEIKLVENSIRKFVKAWDSMRMSN